jgi:putative membrane protein
MRDLAKTFFSGDDRQRIEACIHQAERKTSGEIVVMVVSSSYPYPSAELKAALCLALPASVLLMAPVGGRLWLGNQNAWVFLVLLASLFWLFHEMVKRTVRFRRFFVSKSEMTAEVEEAAQVAFYREGLHRTRDETGVLVFISLFEQQVVVLADRGIQRKLAPDVWKEVVDITVKGIKDGRRADAVCRAVAKAGEILGTHFPPRPADTDELKGVIVGD